MRKTRARRGNALKKCGTPEEFGRAVGERARQDDGRGDSQSGDMGQRTEIIRAGAVAHP